jgi:hypothetical protein
MIERSATRRQRRVAHRLIQTIQVATRRAGAADLADPAGAPDFATSLDPGAAIP